MSMNQDSDPGLAGDDDVYSESEAAMGAAMDSLPDVDPNSPEYVRDLRSIQESDPHVPAQTAPKAQEDTPAAEEEETGEQQTEAPEVEAKAEGEADPKAKEAKPEEKKPGVPDDDTDLDKLQPPPSMTKKQQGHWHAFREAAKGARAVARSQKQAAAQLSTEVEALKKQLAERPAANPELEQEVERLRHLEYLHDPEHSSLITKEFDPKIQAAEKSLRGALYSAVRDSWKGATSEQIQKEVDAFVGARVDERTADQWLEDLQAKSGVLPAVGLKRAERAVLDYFEAIDARKEAIAKAPTARQEWEAKKKAAEDERRASFQKEAEDEFAKMSEKDLPDWAKPKQVPDTATPEEKKAAQAHNERLEKELQPVFEQALQRIWGGSAREHVRLAAEVVKAKHYEAEVKRLQGELDKQRKAAQEAQAKVAGVKKAGAISRAVSTPNGTRQVQPETVDLEASLSTALGLPYSN